MAQPSVLAGRPRGGARAPLLALASGLTAGLLPKCPLCLAAYLSAFGVSVGSASIALGLLRPLAFALSALAIAFSLLKATRQECYRFSWPRATHPRR